ncbi:glycosyl transferase family 90 [Vibrio campbellii]|uniref:glycosyl transferase family 90 n=1 Tax=Vibrio campbellii TaxID=680 RepID=UPI00097184B6|nr:glycosyl transferase family 90 [Vibrio campbellii]APX07528.1 lipopolysaccharide A protein [Vibrio campbellii]ARR07763.1 lipopolysaccharide A protein [Vibrio campbellii]OQQ00401.1 lipopolysaccharide A protein [Vibrio campbellii]HDM8216993.1 lipopolysaccharide A protein [Vibrio campbellii]
MRKFKYYFINSLMGILPSFFYRHSRKRLLSGKSQYNEDYLKERRDYYCKSQSKFKLTGDEITTVSNFKKTGGRTYYYDLLKVIRCFPKKFQFKYVNGDVIDIPDEPSFVKSRPIDGNNNNSILLKLNAVRHYNFVEDKIPFLNKKQMAVWRGAGFRPNRVALLKKYFHHPLCNVGRVDHHIAKGKQREHLTDTMTIDEQLEYRYIISLEGKDVATNLKWIMSSNSLCFTPKLRYETWFMEGKLIPGFHYVEVKDDFSDLIEKMEYYNNHTKEALDIIHNANQWVSQFKNTKQEHLISLMVADKYFEQSGQKQSND